MARNRTDVLAEYSELIETIRKIKREKHSKRVEFELILESYGDDCESVRILIDKLVRNGVLLLEMDNKSRKMISTTDVDVHTVLETLCETSEENNSDERKSVKIVREESRWLDDKMENDDRDIQNSTNRDAFTCYVHDHNSIERDAFPCFDDENDYITKKDLRLHTREITKKFESVLKEITIGNAMIYEKFENYQKELLQGKLNSLHEAVQVKTSELRRLSVECDVQKTTAPNTPDSDIPSRQPCNIPSFSQHSSMRPTTPQTNPDNENMQSTPSILRSPSPTPLREVRPQLNSRHSVRRRPQVICDERQIDNNKIHFKTKSPINTVPGNSTYANIAKRGKKSVCFTDSHGSRIKGRVMSEYIENGIAIVRPFPGATSDDMQTYVLPTIKKEVPDKVIIHVGCVDILRGEKDPRQIANKIFDIARVCRGGGVNNIFLSGILTMSNFNNNLIAKRVNDILSTEGQLEHFVYIDNSRITKDMFYDKVHFNDEGRNLLANNFINTINGNFLY